MLYEHLKYSKYLENVIEYKKNDNFSYSEMFRISIVS